MASISDLISQVDSLRASLDALNEVTKPADTVWDKIKFKLSEQGSQRGLVMIASSIVPYFGLPVETTLQIMSAMFLIIGSHDTLTEG